MRARCERRVTDDRFGIGMRMMRIAIDNAIFPEIAKAAIAESIVVAGRQIATQLINGDLQYQFWPDAVPRIGTILRVRVIGDCA